MSSMTDVLTALGNEDPGVRLPAERQIQQGRQADLSGFLHALVLELSDESKPVFTRQMAGTVLKNSIAPSVHDPAVRRVLEGDWMALPPEVRTNVKQGVLSVLGSPNKLVRNVAANIVGSLSRIELPSGQWPNLLDVLLGAAECDNEDYQEASLTSIGYICEECREYDSMEEALVPFANRILSAVLRGMTSRREDLCYYATNALCNAMEFIHGNMQQQEQRDRLVDALCTTSSSCQSTRTREKAMESLVRVAEMYYSTLPNYIDRLHAITTNAIFNDEETVGLQAMLFWISICETEEDMKTDGDPSCLFYALKGASTISSIALKALEQQEEGQEEGDWNISIAGGKLLQSLALCIGDPIIELVMPFVYSKIGCPTWREKDAAIMAFGCILSGPDPKNVEDLVSHSLPVLLQYVRDDHPVIADTTGWALAVVCQLFSDVFLQNPDSLRQLMDIMTPMINSGTNMALRACHILQNLALAYEEEECQPHNELSVYFADLVTVLLMAIDNSGNQNIKSVAQEALNALVDAAAVDCYQVLNLLVPELQKRMRFMMDLRLQGKVSNADAMTTLGLLCGSLGSVAKKLQGDFVAHLPESMEIMMQIFQYQSDTVLDEALTMFGAFAHAVKSQLVPYISGVAPYVLKALQCIEESDLVIVAVGTLGDLALGLREDIAPYIGVFLGEIHKSLMSPDVDRTLKCPLISCLGDIALSVGDQNFGQYLDAFMQIARALYEQSSTLDIANDPEQQGYVMELWESILAFYAGVCQCFRTTETQLAPYLQSILEFALRAAEVSKQFGYFDAQFSSVTLIGDMACVLKGVGNVELREQAKRALLVPAVWNAVQEATAIGDDPNNKHQMEWVIKQLQVLGGS